jgi:orotidine-5'-phosphate decarboxylase
MPPIEPTAGLNFAHSPSRQPPPSAVLKPLMTKHFADRLITRTRSLGHPLCVGLDPFLDRIPPLFRNGDMSPSDERTAPAVGAYLRTVVDRLEGKVAVVKPQIAFFETMGWRGIRMLSEVVEYARARDLLVLMDAKRGDIGSTAEGYAEAYLGPNAPTRADAITLNPYLGRDTLEPFATKAEAHGSGLFVLVKTSNPGSGDYQDLDLGGTTLFRHVAASLVGLSDRLKGPETGWSALGIVAGATYPEQAEQLRDVLPNALFLIPGYGAQGGGAADSVRSFVQGPNGPEGGIVSSSRDVLFPKDGDTDNAQTWERAFDEGLARAGGGLAEALARR